MKADLQFPRRLRVLALVTDAFGGVGGIAQYNCDFLCSLVACIDVEEVIILPRSGAISAEGLSLGLRQYPPVHGRLAYSLTALRVAWAHRPIDVVFCGHVLMAPIAAGVARLLQAPLWIQVHGIDAWDELSKLHRRSIEAAALVTSVSRYTRRRLLEWVNIDPTRVKVLPNTVHPRFVPGPKPDYLIERHSLRGSRVLLTVSRLASSERYKGHDRVIRILPRVLAEYPETIYLIAGEGEDRARLEAIAAECGLETKVHFAGYVSTEELPDYFRLADVFVMPSTGEGFGIAFLEARQAGTPVVGGNRDGSVDALLDGALGTLVDPDDENELFAAIKAALCAPKPTDGLVQRFRRNLFAEHVDVLTRTSFAHA